MSDIRRRWNLGGLPGMRPDDIVCVVTYADHVAAVAAAVEQDRKRWSQPSMYDEGRHDEREKILNDWALGQMQGNSNGEWILNAVRQKNREWERERIRKAVEVLPEARDMPGVIAKSSVLAVIDDPAQTMEN
jgi:hypothetical protein